MTRRRFFISWISLGPTRRFSNPDLLWEHSRPRDDDSAASGCAVRGSRCRSGFRLAHPDHRRFPPQNPAIFIERLEAERHVRRHFRQKRTVGLHRHLSKHANIPSDICASTRTRAVTGVDPSAGTLVKFASRQRIFPVNFVRSMVESRPMGWRCGDTSTASQLFQAGSARSGAPKTVASGLTRNNDREVLAPDVCSAHTNKSPLLAASTELTRAVTPGNSGARL